MADYSAFDYTTDGPPSRQEAAAGKVAASLLICVLGLLGNLVVVAVVLTLREYRKSNAHWYVLQLSVADSLFLLSLPFQVAEDVQGRWLFPDWLCKLKEAALFLNYYASVAFLVVMTLDRYLAICHPIRAKLHKAPTRLVTAVTWCASLLVCVPVVLYSSKLGSSPDCICTSFVYPKVRNHTQKCLDDGIDDDFCRQVYGALEGLPHCKPPAAEILASKNVSLGSFFGDYSGDYDVYTDYNYSQMGAPLKVNKECSYAHQGTPFKAFLVFNFVVMFVVPFAIMTSCYTLIVIRLFRGGDLPIHRRMKQQHSNQSHNSNSNHGNNSNSNHNNSNHSNHNYTNSNHNNSNHGNRKGSNHSEHNGNHGNRPSHQHSNHFHYHDNQGASKRRKSSSTSDKELARITAMFVALVAAFGLCWVPFHGFHIARIVGFETGPDSNLCETFPVVATLLGYANSAINPFLYTFMLKNFAKRLRNTSRTIRSTVVRSVKFRKPRETKLSVSSVNRQSNESYAVQEI